MFEQLGLIGCGLMGGSFALALKRAGLVKRVVGYSKSPSTTERARLMGVIDVEAPSALLAVSGADLVLLAVPVAATEATFKAIRHLLTNNTLVMDVGSTKREVIDAARRVLRDQVGCLCPPTPSPARSWPASNTPTPICTAVARSFLPPSNAPSPPRSTRPQQCGLRWAATSSSMSPEAHDAAYAAVSHLPHMIAFAMMNAIKGQAQADEFLSLAGPGFRDFTRIAASDPNVWRDILISNREELLAQSRHFQRALHALEQTLSEQQRRCPGNPDRQSQPGACALAHEHQQTQELNTPDNATGALRPFLSACIPSTTSTFLPLPQRAAPFACQARKAFPTGFCCWRP